MNKTATLSGCQTFRYRLTRDLERGFWGKHGALAKDESGVLFIMLNPSTADASLDDPTIRRCLGYTKSWGCSSLTVVNLFAFRATDPKSLLARLEAGEDAQGPDADKYLREAIDDHQGRGDYIVVAWGSLGSHKLIKPRRDAVLRMLPVADTHCLETCASGDPKHPLYCRADLGPVHYEFPRSAWEVLYV